MANSPTVEYISECFIQPKYTPEESRKPFYLSPWDLALGNAHYDQKGLLFAKPPSFNADKNEMKDFLEKLKASFSLALIHFFPLAGRLTTLKQENPPIYSIYIDCVNSPGAKFIHASLNLTISDILSPIYVPKIIQSFFDHVGAINHDGHAMPLATIQVTELIDGIFIGPSINHMLVDGISLWHFMDSWSEIFNVKTSIEDQNILGLTLSRPPNHNRWFPEGHGPVLNLPFSHHDEFIFRYQVPETLKERIFHFSSESLLKLKAKANVECDSTMISTFQALCALVWRCVTRAWNLPQDQITRFQATVNNRSRIRPPLSEDYFGNAATGLSTVVSCGDLLNNGLGWAAWKLHEMITNYSYKSVLESTESWMKNPRMVSLGMFSNTIHVGSSPRFNVYGSDFGLAKALAVRSGLANKLDGKIALYPAREGGGNIDMEICLSPHTMTCLESDNEFLETVSLQSPMNY